MRAGWGLLGKGGGMSGGSGRRVRVLLEAWKLVLGPRGQGQVGVCMCWVGTVGQRGGLSGDSGKRFRVRWCARKLVSGSRRCRNSKTQENTK